MIEDERLRKTLIDASVKIEGMLRDKKTTIDRRIVSNAEWGLEADIDMEQPKPDKPIIFRYTYRINRVKFLAWLEDHKYLMGGAYLIFTSKGLLVTIPGPETNKYAKTFAEIVVKYDNEDEHNLYHRPNIVEESITFVVHREVLNNHDWIVKCLVP